MGLGTSLGVKVVPSWLPMRAKGASKAPQQGQKRAKRAPRPLQEHLLGRQVAPKWTQDGPGMTPGGARWFQHEPSWLQNGAQNAKTSQSKNVEKTHVFVGFFASGRAKIAPRSLQNHHLGPRRSQVAAGQVPAMAQGTPAGPKESQECAKTAPRAPLRAPSRPKVDPR